MGQMPACRRSLCGPDAVDGNQVGHEMGCQSDGILCVHSSFSPPIPLPTTGIATSDGVMGRLLAMRFVAISGPLSKRGRAVDVPVGDALQAPY